MPFTEVDRPERNDRTIGDDGNSDLELENALLHTSETGRAVVLPLGQFHSSPAKGRLWTKGYSVRHRRIAGFVVAWVEWVGLPVRKRKLAESV